MRAKTRGTYLAALTLAVVTAYAVRAPAQPTPIVTNPTLPENAVERVSPHVYVIRGFPNIGIVVGERATLVVDTGLGARNGALIARAARKLSTHGQRLYLTTTHFHPEHTSGQGGFPADTTVIRNRAQQAELDANGARMDALFASGSAQMKKLLGGDIPTRADILFERALQLDLGGVHAQLRYYGAAHTQGDEVTFIPEDSLLLPGDVVQNQISPNFTCDVCAPGSWIAVLDQVATLHPRIIIPDHGGFGGEALIAQERAFLVDLQTRVAALKAQGLTAAQAGRQIAAEFAGKYTGWQTLGNLPQSVQHAYREP
ncbi:MAG TPA: MBL fold metallo-hydrolase [Steroidobacteraceae bacterium]|jgi:glyoxylase-like metal-dependent hydrolase (beta-lactamase superfamily II)|nr:MBL fold metallo-hydrolase [Steroidobacteraceae bacterium]